MSQSSDKIQKIYIFKEFLNNFRPIKDVIFWKKY
jgi:hypothetical protein